MNRDGRRRCDDEGRLARHRNIHRPVRRSVTAAGGSWQRDARARHSSAGWRQRDAMAFAERHRNDQHTSSPTISRNCVDRRSVKAGAVRGLHNQQVTLPCPCSPAGDATLSETRLTIPRGTLQHIGLTLPLTGIRYVALYSFLFLSTDVTK